MLFSEHSLLDALADAPFLKILTSMHINNKTKQHESRRYTNLEKDICAFKYLSGGRLDYTTAYKNQAAMCPKTVLRYIKDNTDDVQEGVINVKGLKKYLVSNGFPMRVSLCEDGTRITPAIEYDHSNNELRGLVADLDEHGLPKTKMFTATSPYKMKADIETKPVGNYAYVVMAMPLSPRAAPFVLYHSCSNNRFTADDVLRRWAFEEELLGQEGIEVVAHCSDGDPRLLKAMKMRAGLYEEDRGSVRWGEFFAAKDDSKITVPVQDPPHLMNKMRNRYAHSKKLPDLQIGNWHININKYLCITIETCFR